MRPGSFTKAFTAGCALALLLGLAPGAEGAPGKKKKRRQAAEAAAEAAAAEAANAQTAPVPDEPPPEEPPTEPEAATEPAPEPAPEASREAVVETAPETQLAADPEPEPAPEPPADPARLLEESLEAYESAEVFWQQGAFDDAFAALDHAYELMAAVPLNGDALLAQEKEDLRHLISRRVVEIYASRRTAVGDLEREIPIVVNDEVQREIASFQGPERDFFVESYRRSGLYRPMILEELAQAGLPQQLSWMPLVESGFKVRALSRARALGMWQFISSTGYRYGLQRSWWVDERMDPLKSTRAAIGYLTDLHNLFGDWLTALAAYNCGEHAVLRRIASQPVSYFDQFWDLYQRLPRETRRYVPRFLAVLAILDDPAAYGFDLPEPLPPVATETVEIERATQLASLDGAMGLAAGTLAELNPELRRKATPDEHYELRLPTGQGETLLARLPELPEWIPPEQLTTVHRVRRGETLSGVAARYGTSVRSIMDLNGLRNAHRIWPGQQLRVPDGRGPAVATARLAPGQEVAHRVRRGESLWILARRYGTTVDRIRHDNGLDGNLLQPGQELKIRGPGAPAAGAGTYVVQSGDTLGNIARHQGVPLDRLLEANGLSRRSTIYPGQALAIPK